VPTRYGRPNIERAVSDVVIKRDEAVLSIAALDPVLGDGLRSWHRRFVLSCLSAPKCNEKNEVSISLDGDSSKAMEGGDLRR
jgi:hypothetical protein